MEQANLDFGYFERKLSGRLRQKMFVFYKFHCDGCKKSTPDATLHLNGAPTVVCALCSIPRRSFTERMKTS